MPKTNYAELARAFMVGTERPTIYHDGLILGYEGNRYEEVPRERLGLLVRRWSQATMREELKTHEVNEVVHSLLAATMTGHRKALPFWGRGEGPPVESVIPFANGLLDLGTWHLTPHTPDWVCNYCLPYDHDDRAKCHQWLAALDAVYEGDPERIGLLQEWMGYCMSADTSQHKLLGLTGVQRSLKSTILRMLALLVGEENVAALRLGQLAQQFGLMGLIGKQLAIISEVELDGNGTEAIVETLKSITGEDLQQVNRKGLAPLNLKLPTRFAFAANRMPLLFDGSAALADRLMLLEHRVSWLGREDRDLPDRLAAEIEGVAVWALEGLKRLRHRGRFPVVDSDTMTRFRRASASVDRFLKDRCIVHADFAPAYMALTTTQGRVEVGKQDLFLAYVDYCDKWGLYPKFEKGFHGELIEKLPGLAHHSYRPHGKPRSYRGIAVARGDDTEAPPEKPRR